jgi:Transmembrane exosortase (Exosortase_EpsH).
MKTDLKDGLFILKRKIMPFRGVFVFVIVVLFTHLFWKIAFHTGIDNLENEKAFSGNDRSSVLLTLKGDLWKSIGVGGVNNMNKDSRYISLFNKDISDVFTPWAEKTAMINFLIVNVISGERLFLKNYVTETRGETKSSCTLLSYAKSNIPDVNIVWGCTGVKQIYIFFFVILFSRGIWWKKFFYFLSASSLLLVFNIIRISTVLLCIKDYPDSFSFLHDFVFKYLFYGLIFLLWLLWEERLSEMCFERFGYLK